MSEFKYQSSRCTTNLRLVYAKRAGSVLAVSLMVDGKQVLRLEPNALGQFADWLRFNAEVCEGEHADNFPSGPDSQPGRLEEGT